MRWASYFMKKPFQTSKLGRLDDVGGKVGGNSSHVHGLGPLPFKCPSAEVKGIDLRVRD